MEVDTDEQEILFRLPAAPRRVRVGITYNLKKQSVTGPPDAEAEFDDLSTIQAIQKALEDTGCDAELFEADETLPERLLRRKPDIVFNIAEGLDGRGREARVPAILNYLNIPFTGSDETTMCVAIDKALTKRLLASYRIRTPRYRVVANAAMFSNGGLRYPVIVKPNAEGSSKGVSRLSVAGNAGELKRALAAGIDAYKQEMLVEEFVAGREFTVGILGNQDMFRVFPPMEIIFKDSRLNVYGIDIKPKFNDFVYYKCPPDIDDEASAEIMRTAGRIFQIMRCRDCARMDFRMSPDGRLYFIEINPLPGLAPGYSDFPMLAEFNGVGYESLVRGILDYALARYGMYQFISNKDN